MRVCLAVDELWPFFNVTAGIGKEVPVDSDTLSHWVDTMKNFKIVQAEMRAIYEEQTSKA